MPCCSPNYAPALAELSKGGLMRVDMKKPRLTGLYEGF